MKEKLKTKSFWLTIVGAVIMLLQAFGLKINGPLVNEIITALCSIAIVTGIMIDDTKKKEETPTEDNSIEEPPVDKTEEAEDKKEKDEINKE